MEESLGNANDIILSKPEEYWGDHEPKYQMEKPIKLDNGRCSIPSMTWR